MFDTMKFDAMKFDVHSGKEMRAAAEEMLKLGQALVEENLGFAKNEMQRSGETIEKILSARSIDKVLEAQMAFASATPAVYAAQGDRVLGHVAGVVKQVVPKAS